MGSPRSVGRHLAFFWNHDKSAAVSKGRTAAVWSVPDGELLYEVEQRNRGIRWAGFSAGDSLLLTQTFGLTQAWNAEDGSMVGEVESLAFIGGFLKDGSLVATEEDADNTLIKWDSTEATFEELWPRLIGYPVAVSPDSRLLATSIREAFVGNDRKEINRVEVWDLPNQRKLASVDGILAEEFLFTPDQSALLIVLYGGRAPARRPERHQPAARSRRSGRGRYAYLD